MLYRYNCQIPRSLTYYYFRYLIEYSNIRHITTDAQVGRLTTELKLIQKDSAAPSFNRVPVSIKALDQLKYRSAQP